MNKIAMKAGAWATLPLLMLMLAGCASLLAGVLPDVDVSNPLQFDGASIEVGFPAAGISAITLQSVTGSGALDQAIGFSDDPDIAGPVSPATLQIDGGFSGDAVLVADVYPDEIVLSDIALTVRLWQGAETFAGAGSQDRIEPDPFSYGDQLTMTKVAAGCAANCTYAFAVPAVAGSSLQIEIDGGDLDRTLEILNAPPDANFVEVTLELTASSTPDIGPGSTLTLTLDAADGKLTF